MANLTLQGVADRLAGDMAKVKNDMGRRVTQSAGDARWSRANTQPVDGTNAAGVDPTGANDSTAAMQAVLDAHTLTSFSSHARVVKFVGTFKIASTLYITGHADLSGALINYTGTGSAIEIGRQSSGQLWKPRVQIGTLVCVNKPAGANWLAGSRGLTLRNVFQGDITYTRIRGFETNLMLYGDGAYGQGGTAYNTLHCGVLEDGLVNESLQLINDGAPSQGWVNENLHFGGSWKHYEGTYPVTGMRNILVHVPGNTFASINNNRWIGCSLEGQREEYLLDCNSSDNLWLSCRWEFPANNGSPPVIWRQRALRNWIVGGYASDKIQLTTEVGAYMNWLVSSSRVEMEMSGDGDGGLTLSNEFGSTSGTINLMKAGWRGRAGKTISSNWIGRFTAARLRLKGEDDVTERIIIDPDTTAITFGDGAATPAQVVIKGGSTEANSTVTANKGSLYLPVSTAAFPAYLKVTGTATNTGWQSLGFAPFTTASRPTAAVAGVGGTYWDTTVNRPLWSDGTSWRDPAASTAGVVELDSFAGADDDAKFLAALTYAAAQTRVPAVRLRAGVTTLANSYDMFTGMKVVGAGAENMAFGEEVGSGKAVISKIRFTGASGTSSLFKSAATINYVTVANLAFHGDTDCQIFQSTGNVYGAQFHNLDFYGCLSAFGNATNKFLMTFAHFTGFWTVNAPAGTQFWLGGSDNTLWMGGQANIGGNPSTAGAGLYLVELQGLSKTNVGYAYITANNGWRGLRTSGDCTGLTLYGGVYEGQNDGDPSYGNLIRCEGTGTVRIRDPFLAYGMTSPAGTEHGIVEVACSANGQVLLDGFTYRRDNDVAETVPVAYVSGGTLRVLNGMADKQYNAWTGLPRVQNAGGTLTNDTSVTVLP